MKWKNSNNILTNNWRNSPKSMCEHPVRVEKPCFTLVHHVATNSPSQQYMVYGRWILFAGECIMFVSASSHVTLGGVCSRVKFSKTQEVVSFDVAFCNKLRKQLTNLRSWKQKLIQTNTDSFINVFKVLL